MVHSIELLLDAESDAAIRSIWAELAEAGLPSQLRNESPSNRPHVSVVVAERIDPGVDRSLSPIAQRLPLRCTIGAPVLFGGQTLTMARLVVPSAELLSLHRDIHEVCRTYVSSAPMTHTVPGDWTPHVTLCRRLQPSQLASALTKVRSLTRELSAEFVAMRRWDGDQRVECEIRRG